MKYLNAVFAGCLLMLAMPLLADQDKNGPYNRVSLSAQVAQTVDNDRMEIRFAARAEHDDPLQVAERLNRAMAKALAAVASEDGVDVGTGNYRINPVYGKSSFGGGRMIEHWQGYQQLTLGGSDLAQLRGLAAKVQEQVVIEGMGFSVSPGLREKTEEALLEPAIRKLQKRAQQIQQALGKSGYEIVLLNVGQNGSRPPVVMADMAMSARAQSAPAVAAGTSRVVVSVSAMIELR